MNNTESIPENIFWQELKNDSEIKYQLYGGDWATFINNIIPQYPILNYRVDFALPDEHLVIELDGHDYHKTKEQRTSDAKRERDLKELGWYVIRFTGTEIYRDVEKCVEQVERICLTKGTENAYNSTTDRI